MDNTNIHQEVKVTCNAFEMSVTVDPQGIIVAAAPLAHQFIGKPLDEFATYAQTFGGFNMQATGAIETAAPAPKHVAPKVEPTPVVEVPKEHSEEQPDVKG